MYLIKKHSFIPKFRDLFHPKFMNHCFLGLNISSRERTVSLPCWQKKPKFASDQRLKKAHGQSHGNPPCAILALFSATNIQLFLLLNIKFKPSPLTRSKIFARGNKQNKLQFLIGYQISLKVSSFQNIAFPNITSSKIIRTTFPK